MTRRGSWMLALAAVLAGCGQGETATPPTSTSVPVSASVPVSTSVPVGTSSVPGDGDRTVVPSVASCPEGTSPVAARHTLEAGATSWWHCSAELAWREVLGSSERLVYLTSVTEDSTGTRPVQQTGVVALDAATGIERWRRALAGGSFGWWGRPPGPVAGAGIVVLPVREGPATVVIGADADTGAERWRVGAGELAGTDGTLGPIANTDRVAVIATDHTVAGFDRRSGEPLWSVPFDIVDSSRTGVARATSAVAPLGDGASALIVLPTVQFPGPGSYPPGSLPPSTTELSVALDADTGAERWRAPVLHHPTASGGALVGYVYREEPAPGAVSAPMSLPPMRRPVVQAIDATDGATLWTQPGDPTYGDLWAVGDGIVAVTAGTEDAVHTTAYELDDGAVRWQQAIVPTHYLGAPIAIEGEHLLLLGGGHLSALATDDGTTEWSIATPTGSLESHLAADRGHVYVSFNTMPWRD